MKMYIKLALTTLVGVGVFLAWGAISVRAQTWPAQCPGVAQCLSLFKGYGADCDAQARAKYGPDYHPWVEAWMQCAAAIRSQGLTCLQSCSSPINGTPLACINAPYPSPIGVPLTYCIPE